MYPNTLSSRGLGTARRRLMRPREMLFRRRFIFTGSSSRRKYTGGRATWSSVLLGARKWIQKENAVKLCRYHEQMFFVARVTSLTLSISDANTTRFHCCLLFHVGGEVISHDEQNDYPSHTLTVSWLLYCGPRKLLNSVCQPIV
jgi:hypothetical protein